MASDQMTLNALLDTVRKFVRDRLYRSKHKLPVKTGFRMQSLRRCGSSAYRHDDSGRARRLGLNALEECHVVMELGRTSPAFRSVIGTNNGIGSFALTEPSSTGRNASSRTRRRDSWSRCSRVRT